MNGGDIGLTILIIIIFVSLQLFNILAIGMKNIKDNWSLYRCNPILMPFASSFGHDAAENFTYCTQNMNANFMPYLLDPLHYMVNGLQSEGSSLNKHATGLMGIGSGITTTFENTMDEGYGIILNLYVVFQKIFIKLRDTFMKIIGVITTLLYTLGGLQLTVTSIWEGPIGGFTRTVAGTATAVIGQ